MEEGQRGTRLDDPGSCQGVHQQIDLVRRYPGEPSRAARIHTITEHRSRACQCGGTRGKPAASTPVLLHGEGSSCWPAFQLAVRTGLDIRIGLEDTLQLPDGSPAPANAALVAAAARLVDEQRPHR